jgi:chaperonin GroEL
MKAAVEKPPPSDRRLPGPSRARRTIENVATIAANNDPEVGKIMADAFEKVGKDGVITVEEGKSLETEVTVVEGMQFDRGYLSPQLRDRRRPMKANSRSAYVLVHEDKIEGRQARPAPREGHEGQEAAAHHRRGRHGRGALDARHQQAARHAEGRGGQGARATATAARPCSRTSRCSPAPAVMKDLGVELEAVESRHLGMAKKVEIDNDNTLIIEGAGDAKPTIQNAGQQIRREIEDDVERLRPREAPGAAREARGRRRADQASARPPRPSSRRRRPASRTRCTRPARPSKRASSPVAASRSSAPGRPSTG